MSRAATPMLFSSAGSKPRMSWLNPAYLPLIATLLVILALATFGGLRFEGYLNAKALANLFNNSAYLGIVAIGMTFVILSGGIDLSVGSAIAFATVLMAVLVHPSVGQQIALDPSLKPEDLVHGGGLHPITAGLLTLIVGTLFGMSMGALIAIYDLPPFMITLAGMFLARAMAFVVLDFVAPVGSGSASLPITHGFFQETLPSWAVKIAEMPGKANRRGIIGPPTPVRVNPTAILMLASYGIAMLILHFTSFGRNVYAVGGDENSSRLLGVRVPRVKISVYAISGFCAALAGVVASIDSNAGNPADRVGVELDAIAAVVIGGTLLTGGRGFVIGTLFGVLVLALIQNFTNVTKMLNAQTTRIFIGALMLVFILLQTGFNAFARWLATSGGKRGAAAH